MEKEKKSTKNIVTKRDNTSHQHTTFYTTSTQTPHKKTKTIKGGKNKQKPTATHAILGCEQQKCVHILQRAAQHPSHHITKHQLHNADETRQDETTRQWNETQSDTRKNQQFLPDIQNKHHNTTKKNKPTRHHKTKNPISKNSWERDHDQKGLGDITSWCLLVGPVTVGVMNLEGEDDEVSSR